MFVVFAPASRFFHTTIQLQPGSCIVPHHYNDEPLEPSGIPLL
jgi:hypothetical protein